MMTGMRDKANRIFSVTALLVLLVQILLFVLSWIITATNPDLDVRSLLSGEGLRWFIGGYVNNQTNFVLVWILLLSISLGAVKRSGLPQTIRRLRNLGFRERLALQFVFVELVLFLIILFLLTCVPHAVLLNVAGNLYPGSFSMGFVALLSFALCVFAVTYHNVVVNGFSLSEMFGLLTFGISVAAPLFVLYLLISCLYHSVCFVFML